MTTQYPDVPIQSVSQEVYEKKYRLMDYHGNPVDLNIQDTYKRVAKALASVEDDSTKWEKEFYWALENGAIPAGRIISNAGAEDYKPSTSTINCTVSGRIDDSMESILDRLKEAGLTLKAGCGIGYHFSSLRPKGALVSGVGAATSGPLSFMDVFDALCATVSSAGGRRGAQMATFLIRHPDVLDYVKAKRQDGRLRQFNMSVLVTEDFLQALQNDQEWEFMFPVRLEEHDLYPNAEYKFMHWYEELDYSENYIYNMEDSEQVLCKVYGRMKATEIWDVIAESTYDYAEPGVIFIDEYNKMNNNWFCETILATNPSMPAGTLVHTDLGILPIEDLENKIFKVRSLDGVWAEAKCRLSSESATLVEIEFTGNRKIRCTPEHKWPVYDRNSKTISRIEAKELSKGHLVPLNLNKPLEFCVDSSYTKDEGFLVGVFMGNGWLSRRKDSDLCTAGISFNKEDVDLAEKTLCILNSLKEENSSIKENSSELVIQWTSQKFTNWFRTKFSVSPGIKEVPSILWTSNDEFISGFLDGLFSTDGSFDISGGGVLVAKRYEFISDVAKLLSFIGVKCSISPRNSENITFPNGKNYEKSYSGWCLEFSRPDTVRFSKYVELSSSRKQSRINDALNIKVEKDRITNYFNKIKSVKYIEGAYRVWDISVYHNQHVFPTEWGYTGNCGEQGLPPWGACLLGSINLTKFVNNPFLEDAHFDSIKFEKVVRIFTRMLDNVVEINGLPLDKQRDEIYRKRRHGMGFTGLGSALTMLRIKYGSKEALEFTKKVSLELAHIGWRTGLELAIEKGPAPIFEEGFVITKRLLRLQPALEEDGYKEGDVVKGITLFVKYSNYMRKLKEELQDDAFFEELENKGCRFTHHSSIAPTGTISLALANNASNGIEPSFSHMYFRNLTVEGKKTRQQVPVYSYELLLYRHLINKDASPESGTLPDYFISSDMVLPSQHIDMQAASQEWIDSSISKTINCPTDMKFESFKNIYSYAAEKGLKGCTTFRFNPTSMTGVLTRKEDLDSTLYKFYLEDGTEIELKGSDKVEYEGEIHNVAMLYDSIKEGRYDRGY